MAHKSRPLEEADGYERQRWVEHEDVASGTEPDDLDVATPGEKLRAILQYSSAYLAVIASLQALLVLWLLSLPLNLAPAVIGLVTFSVYSTDRIADADTDTVAKPKQAEFVQKHSDTLYFMASLAYSVAVALSILGGPLALGITLLPGLFWVLYASDWISTSSARFSRLKDVLFVNTGIVAFAWAFTLTFLPLAFANAGFSPVAGFAFAYFFLGVVVSTEIPNVRDIDEDAEIGVSTVPVVFGVLWTRHFLYAIEIVLLALISLVVYYGYVSVPLAIGFATATVYSLGVTAFVGRTERYDRLTVAIESQYVVAAAVVIVLTTVV